MAITNHLYSHSSAVGSIPMGRPQILRDTDMKEASASTGKANPTSGRGGLALFCEVIHWSWYFNVRSNEKV